MALELLPPLHWTPQKNRPSEPIHKYLQESKKKLMMMRRRRIRKKKADEEKERSEKYDTRGDSCLSDAKNRVKKVQEHKAAKTTYKFPHPPVAPPMKIPPLDTVAPVFNETRIRNSVLRVLLDVSTSSYAVV